MKRLAALSALSALLLLAACAHRDEAEPVRYFQPTAAQIGPELNSYGEAVLPEHALIVVQGDELAYGVGRRPTRHRINGADEGQAALTISESLRQVLGTRQVRIENRGVPGDTVAAGARRWAGAQRPDLLILAYGFGDMAVHTQVDPFGEGLLAMIRAAHAQGSAVFVVTPPMLSDKLANANLSPYRSRADAIARAAGAEVFPAATAMATAKESPTTGAPQTARTYQVIAGSMLPYIKVIRAPA